MPIYAYKCSVCGSEFERKQKFDDAPLTECPQGHQRVRRVYSPAGIVFKGSGFYMTDYVHQGKDEGGSKSTDKE